MLQLTTVLRISASDIFCIVLCLIRHRAISSAVILFSNRYLSLSSQAGHDEGGGLF